MEHFVEAWEGVKQYCKDNMHQVAYNVWIQIITPIGLEEGNAILSVRSIFQKEIIEKNYINIINKGFEETFGFVPSIVINTESDDPPPPPVIHQEFGPPVGLGLAEYEYTFDTFIVGSSNRFAFAASQAVADKPSSVYNPLFLHGGSGLGKTHLLFAICNQIRKQYPTKKITYIRGEDFTNELISSISNRVTTDFHDKYRKVDVLLVDDIQFIAGKQATQEEFFHTFDTLYQAGKQIVLASDRPPKEIQSLEDRLRTRFESGLLTDVQPPDLETRIAIMKRKAEYIKFEIPDDVCLYIAEKIKTNIRQLEGVVKKMRALYQIGKKEPNIITAGEAIRDILNDDQPPSVTVDRIINEVARVYNVDPSDIRSKKRSSLISLARQVSMYVIREITQITLEKIGEEIGRDYSTIIYSIKQIEENMERDASFKNSVNDIVKNLRAN